MEAPAPNLDQRLAAIEEQLAAVAEQLRLARIPLPPRCLTVAEVCDILGVAKRTVHRLIQAGELKVAAIPCGSRLIYRVQPDELRNFLDQAQRPSVEKDEEDDFIVIPD